MSTKKGKSKAAAKRKRAVPANRKSAVPGHDAVLQRQPLQGKWTQFIVAGEPAVIAHNISLCMAIKNAGPSTVLVSTNYGRDEQKIAPNALRLIHVLGTFTVEVMGGKCATVEMEFMPRSK